MKETRFIAQNKEKWAYFEEELRHENISPDDLQRMYVELTDDLSFARTFYPNRSVRVYLNTLSQKVFTKLYQTKKSPWNRFVDYWRYDLPITLYDARHALFLALAVFLISVTIGVVSSMIDPEFPRMILGDSYIETTLANIKKGDPLAIYKSGSQIGSTLGITANNIFVALRTFLFGILAGIGSLVILLHNGIMVGAFQYFFVSKGYGWDSFLGIWLHGTFEISAIVIAGGAGFTVGKGLLFPGTYSRLQSFQRGAYKGFEIMTGIVPIFIVAGFVEGFFTRYTDAPTYMRLGFILFSAAVVLFYFGFYPYYVVKQKKYAAASTIEDLNIVPDNQEKVNMQTLRTAGEVQVEGLNFFVKMLGTAMQSAFVFTVLHLSLMFYLSLTDIKNTFGFNFSEQPNEYLGFFLFLLLKIFEPLNSSLIFYSSELIPYLWLLNSLFFALFLNILMYQIEKMQDEDLAFSMRVFIKKFLCLLPVTVCLHFLLSISTGWMLFIGLIFFLSFFLIWSWASVQESNIFQSLLNSISVIFNQFSFNLLCNLGYISIALIFFILIDSVFWSIIIEFITMQFYTTYEDRQTVDTVLKSFSLLFTTYLLLAYFITSGGFLYFSIKELQNAKTLLQKISEVKLKKQIKGLEIE